MPKDLDKLFDDLLARYIKAIEKDYKTRYKNARDKDFVLNEIRIENGAMQGLFDAVPELKKMIDVFFTRYNRGESVTTLIAHLRTTYGEIDDVKPFRRIKENGERVTLYLSAEEKELKQLALNERRLMKVLIRYCAYAEIAKRLPTLFTANTTQAKAEGYPIKWTGEKDNRNEFVQLIYGLHQAKLINKGEGEITKIVEELAALLQVNLGTSWQSNLSSSIHKTKTGYNPQIFSKIRSAYEEYAKGLVEEKKKNR